jgi:predicted nucleic acid-binding protein
VIVVDSNVIFYCWVLGDKTGLAQRVRLGDPVWHAPILWRSEVRNVLTGYVVRDVIKPDRAAAIMATAEGALAGCEHFVSSDSVLDLAVRTRLSAYDCEFVALAQSLAVPLVTEDRAILKAFPDLAMSMEEFLERFPPAQPAAHEKRKRYRTSRQAGQERLARYRELQARIDAAPRPAGRVKPPISREQLYEEMLAARSGRKK